MIKRLFESACLSREKGDLGGSVTFVGCDPVPCSMGVDLSGLSRADNSAGFQEAKTRTIVVRESVLETLPRTPRAGDTVEVQGNLEAESAFLTIMPATGIENANAIVRSFVLYQPNV